jgi:hypothetical protein
LPILRRGNKETTMSLTRVLVPLVSIACCSVAFAQQPSPTDADQGQFAVIRPTHRLIAAERRTVRRSRTIPGVPERKSGNISPLKRELPKAVVQPPKTRRRDIPW